MKSNGGSLNRLIGGLVLVGLAVVTVWVFPLFRVVPLDRVQDKSAPVLLAASESVTRAWPELSAINSPAATPVAELVAAIKASPADARQRFGRQPGIGSNYFYFVRGEGRVVSVKTDEIEVSLTPAGNRADLVIATGNLSGNTVRDAVGVFKVDDYPSSQEFNRVSAELNRRIETEVLPGIRRDAKTGAKIAFVGCLEVTDEKKDLATLRLVAVNVVFQ